MSDYDDGRKTARVSLSTLVAQLRESCETASRLQGGNTSYREELAIFRETCAKDNLYLPKPPSIIGSTPSFEGNEHQVWYLKEHTKFIKITWPDHFGMKVIYRHDEEPSASPIDYLERWLWHNKLFGDSVHFIGALETPQGLRLLIEQPALDGKPATDEHIRSFFESSGWKKFQVNKELAFYDELNNIVISDTHRGNIILMEDGLLAPIDVRVQRLSPSLTDAIQQLL